MLAYVNGHFVPEDRPAITVRDRSFSYGDGLFETVRIIKGQALLWREHVDRLFRGAEFLKIERPCSLGELEDGARDLLVQNFCSNGFLKIHLSRGPSERGYSTFRADRPSLVMTAHPAELSLLKSARVITSTLRVLANDPLSHFKTANRLPNILARQQADEAKADEALILNEQGTVAGGSASNLFVLEGAVVRTPPVSSGALAGVTRGFVIKSLLKLGHEVREETVSISELKNADGAFLTSTGMIVTPVRQIGGRRLPIAKIASELRAICLKTCSYF